MDKTTAKKILTTALMAIIGGAIGMLGAKAGLESTKSASAVQVVALVILALPAFFLVVGVHEAGHAMAGLLVRFDFRTYVVGPFMWDKEQSGWNFKWNRNLNLSGGLVICIPATTENLERRFTYYALGGPAASLMLVGLAYGAKRFMDGVGASDGVVGGLVALMLGLMTILSLLIFIVTIIPMHMGGFYTDGARALRFMRGGDGARFEILLMKTLTISMGGVRPRDLDHGEISEVLELAERLHSPMKAYAHYYLYHHAFDQGQIDEAEQHLKAYLAEAESIPKGMRGSVYLDAAFFYAHARKDLAAAEALMKEYETPAILSKAQLYATEAAMMLLRNDWEGALQKLDLAIRELPNMMDRGGALVLRERLTEMKASLVQIRVAVQTT